MTNTKRDILRCVENGIDTSSGIADQLGLHRGGVNRHLLELVEEGKVVRSRSGRSYTYTVPTATDAADADDTGGDSSATLASILAGAAAERRRERDPDAYGVFDADTGEKLDTPFDWDRHVPDSREYVPNDGELDEIIAEVELAEAVGEPFHGRLTGPTGTAKTTLVSHICDRFDLPMFTVQASHSLTGADIIGRPVGVKMGSDDDPPFEYGPGTKALMSSADRPTVLLIDEVNRAPARVKGDLFRILDDRAQVDITFTGETVQGDPLNLIVFSTMNEGRAYETEPIDLAEVRRLGGEWELDYLGTEHPQREVALLMERTPADEGLARTMVKTANLVREHVDNNPDSPYKAGMPTPLLINWANSAAKYQARDLEEPVVRAGLRQVVPFYKRLGATAAAEVESLIRDRFTGKRILVGPEAAEAAADHEPGEQPDDDELAGATRSMCVECGWADDIERAEETGWECPECGGDLVAV